MLNQFLFNDHMLISSSPFSDFIKEKIQTRYLHDIDPYILQRIKYRKFDRFSFEKEAEEMIRLSAWNGHTLICFVGIFTESYVLNLNLNAIKFEQLQSKK